MTVGAVLAALVLGVSAFQSAGRTANAQAQELGEAVVADPDSLFDKTQVAAKAESLGLTVSFPPQFERYGRVVVHSWLPLASTCLYLPDAAGRAYAVGDEPCNDLDPRTGS